MNGPDSISTPGQIAIAATFVAEPVDQALSFWLEELCMPQPIVFAPYNQVFQQLLDPTSLLSANRSGINVVLARIEDWQRTSLILVAQRPGKASNKTLGTSDAL